MRTLKHRIQGFSQRIKALFQPYLSEDIVDAYQPGLDILIQALRDGGDYMANEMRMKKGQGEMETNEQGAKRESNKGRGRWDLFPYEGLEELAKWFELGGINYGDRNWEKWLSISDTTNRMVRHSIKAANGFMDEGPFAHYAAVAWNAIVAITLIKRFPYLNDHFRDLYLKELGLPNNEKYKDYKSSDELFGHLKSDDNPFEDLLAEVEHDLKDLGYETRQPLPKWEYDKKRVLTDKATAIRVHDIDHRLVIVLDFDSQEDLNEFRGNVAKMGIEPTSK